MYKVSKSGQSGLRGNYRISLCIDTRESPEKVISLITNAPDVLAALEAMVRAVNVDEIDPVVMFVTIEKARAAISKARGEG